MFFGNAHIEKAPFWLLLVIIARKEPLSTFHTQNYLQSQQKRQILLIKIHTGFIPVCLTTLKQNSSFKVCEPFMNVF
jgi:hypothetical protein